MFSFANRKITVQIHMKFFNSVIQLWIWIFKYFSSNFFLCIKWKRIIFRIDWYAIHENPIAFDVSYEFSKKLLNQKRWNWLRFVDIVYDAMSDPMPDYRMSTKYLVNESERAHGNTYVLEWHSQHTHNQRSDHITCECACTRLNVNGKKNWLSLCSFSHFVLYRAVVAIKLWSQKISDFWLIERISHGTNWCNRFFQISILTSDQSKTHRSANGRMVEIYQ